MKIKCYLIIFSYEFKKGFYLLNNPSGTGKSTLIKIIMGLIKTNKNTSILINEKNIDNLNVTNCFSYATQNTTVFDTTVMNNITLNETHENNQEKNNQMKNSLLSISEKLNIESILNNQVGINGNNISGGELKRVVLARMLYFYKKGQVVIFDEPFDGLNSLLIEEVMKIIREFTDNIVIIIDHTNNALNSIENLNICNW